MAAENLNPADFEQLRQYVRTLLPERNVSCVVSSKAQELELESLKRTTGSQRFFFVVDMERFEITHNSGIQQWLGYYEKEFTLKKYWSLVHPGLQKLTHGVFIQMAEILCTGKFELQFMVQRYSSMTALKHRHGNYLLLKRTASVFQYDSDKRLREYLNEFTIIGDYNGEPLQPVFFTDKGELETQRGQVVMEQVVSKFLGLKVFSPAELQVARLLVYQPGITIREISKLLLKSPNTIDTYFKRFLKKAREYFHINFTGVQEAANYLHKNGLL